MDQGQFEATLADAEIRLRRLRTLYDQWFHGLERTEPQTQKAEIERMVTDLRRAQPRNTALRFRFNQLVQRYTTYNTYWQRITRQIEEGTYKRDVLRARRRFGDPSAERDKRNPRDGYELDLDIDIEATLDSVTKSEPPPEASKSVPPRSSRPPPNTDRPQRAQREITPFAMPGDVLSDGLLVPPMPGAPAPAPLGVRAPLPTNGQPIPSSSPKLGVPPNLGVPPKLGASPNLSVPPTLGGAPPKLGVPPNLSVPPKLGVPPPKLNAPPAVPPPQRKPAPPVPPGASRQPPPTGGAVRAPVPPAAAARSAATGNGGLSDDQIHGIYQRYVAARRDNKERTDNVKLETIAKTVRDMLPKLAQKHAGKQIEFEVVVKDGRVALKPVAK
jgi:hypothetical protein